MRRIVPLLIGLVLLSGCAADIQAQAPTHVMVVNDDGISSPGLAAVAAAIAAAAIARIQSDQRRHRSESRMGKLVEHMPDVVLITDLDGRIQYINRAHPQTLHGCSTTCSRRFLMVATPTSVTACNAPWGESLQTSPSSQSASPSAVSGMSMRPGRSHELAGSDRRRVRGDGCRRRWRHLLRLLEFRDEGARAIANWSMPSAPWLLGGSVAYVVGSWVLTIAGNVPLNKRLAETPPHAGESADTWLHYINRWTALNSQRALGSVVSALLFIIALRLGLEADL